MVWCCVSALKLRFAAIDGQDLYALFLQGTSKISSFLQESDVEFMINLDVERGNVTRSEETGSKVTEGEKGVVLRFANIGQQNIVIQSCSDIPQQYTFLSFLAIFEIGSLISGVARSSAMLIIGRAVTGMGGSGLINGALTIMAASSAPEKRPGKQYQP